MPRKGANVSLSSYDDIFSTEQSRTEAGQEHVQEISMIYTQLFNLLCEKADASVETSYWQSHFYCYGRIR